MSTPSKIEKITGRAIPVPGNDIDTDRIMPARYLKCVTFDELGKYVFQDERYDTQGKKEDHPYNDARYEGASILLVNKNFGCGSSREHAPQGIQRSGIKAIVGESFAEIFAGNCVAIGLPAVTVSEGEIRQLMEGAQKDPSLTLSLDIAAKKLRAGDQTYAVGLKDAAQSSFLGGTWDSTATLLSAQDQVKETAGKIPYLHWGV